MLSKADGVINKIGGIPMTIQMEKRTQVIGFKLTMRPTLAKMLRAGRIGTQGTLNRKPSLDC